MKKFQISLILLLSLNSFTISAQTVTAKDIIRQTEELMRGNSSYGEAVMKIVRPDWTREVSMKMWSLGTDLSMVLVTDPPRDRGTATLMRNQEIWNWQPRIERVIKLPPSMMMQSWMGSDFTNDDLVKQSSIVEDYTHELLKDTVIDGNGCYKLRLIPKENAPVVWGRIDMFVTKDSYIQLLVKFYDEENYLVSTMRSSDIQMMGGRLIPTNLEMIPADNPKQKTVFEYRDLQFNVDLKDSFFSLQNMKRLR